MAETWKYEIVWNAGSESVRIPRTTSASVSMKIRRIYPSSLPTGYDGSFYKFVGSSHEYKTPTNASGNARNCIQTYADKFRLAFGSYGLTDEIAQNFSWHDINGTFSPNNALLNVGTSYETFAIKVNGIDQQTTSGGDYAMFGTNTAYEIWVQVEPKYVASTFNVSDVTFGSNSTVTFYNTNRGDLKHTVTWTLDSTVTYTHTETTSTGSVDLTWQVSNAWMNKIPNSESVLCTVSVDTKKTNNNNVDVKIGDTATTNITITVPSSVKPSFTSLTVDSSTNMFNNQYLQKRSGLVLKMNGVTANGYATIASIKLTANVVESWTTDMNAKTFSITTLQNSGIITFNATVTDSRGRVSESHSQQITVVAYAPPSIISVSAARCKDNGIADEQGTYASIRIVASYTPLTGNSMTISSKYYEGTTPSTKYVAVNSMTSGETYIVGNGQLSVNSSYYIEFTVSDTVGNTITRDTSVQSAAFAIHVKNGGLGVAVGQTATYDNTFEINKDWDFRYGGKHMPYIEYTTDSSYRPSSPSTGDILLIKK